MICGTRPHGHRTCFWSSVTSTPNFFPTVGVKRVVCRLCHRSMLGLVVESVPKTVSLIHRSLLHSPSHNLTVSLRLHLCGMRVLTPPMFANSRHDEQLNLLSQQSIVATVEDSVLRTEMSGLESQEEDSPKRILFFKTMS